MTAEPNSSSPSHERRAAAERELGRAAIALIRHEPFFGHLLSAINRDVGDKVETVGVSLRNGRPTLSVNPEFYLEELGDSGERSAVIKHEVLHLLLRHADRRDAQRHDQQLFDLAADLVVNQLMGSHWPLPPGAITFDSFNFELAPGQTLEWYYRVLVEHREEIPPELGSGHSDHDGWEENDEAARAIAENEMSRAVREAKERASESFGLLPTEIQALANSFVGHSEASVDWRRVIRLFATSSRRTRISNTLRRPSKRYGTYPGTKVKRFQSVAVVIDTSGSVKKDALGKFFNEIRDIWRQGSQVTVVEADNIVRTSWPYRGVAPEQFAGRGGTKFDPALQWVADAAPRFDAVIYFTDGKAQAPTVNPGCKILWVLPDDGKSDALEGHRVVRLTP